MFNTCDNMVAAKKSSVFAQKAIREADKLWSEGVINENIIEDALTEISDDEVIESLKKLVRQKRQTIKAKSDYELKGKLIRFAMSRGFSYSTISKVIDTDNIQNDEDY